jgi:hypothetical protein
VIKIIHWWNTNTDSIYKYFIAEPIAPAKQKPQSTSTANFQGNYFIWICFLESIRSRESNLYCSVRRVATPTTQHLASTLFSTRNAASASTFSKPEYISALFQNCIIYFRCVIMHPFEHWQISVSILTHLLLFPPYSRQNCSGVYFRHVYNVTRVQSF